jgi:hypothetical protein
LGSESIGKPGRSCCSSGAGAGQSADAPLPLCSLTRRPPSRPDRLGAVARARATSRTPSGGSRRDRRAGDRPAAAPRAHRPCRRTRSSATRTPPRSRTLARCRRSSQHGHARTMSPAMDEIGCRPRRCAASRTSASERSRFTARGPREARRGSQTPVSRRREGQRARRASPRAGASRLARAAW